MKLYLSSYFLGDNPQNFSSLFTDNKRVGIIMNAADMYGSAKRPDYLNREIASLANIGLQGTELDLRHYLNDPAKLEAQLEQLGGVWIMGGNSFILRRAMQQSGFDKVAVNLIVDNKLVYGGFSAGAVVATKTLRGIDLVDDPHELPDDYATNQTMYEGLGLYEKSIAPHYKSDHPESAAIDTVVAYFKENNMPYVALHDGEAITVNT